MSDEDAWPLMVSWVRASPRPFAALPTSAGRGPARRYLAPDTLEAEPVSATYSEWLGFAITGEVERFHRDLRPPGWEQEAAALEPDQGIMFAPPPWSEEGRERAAAHRGPVPVTALWDLWHDAGRQVGRGPGS